MVVSGAEQVAGAREGLALSELSVSGGGAGAELRNALSNQDIVVCGPGSIAARCLEQAGNFSQTRFLLIGIQAPGRDSGRDNERDNVVTLMMNRREHGFLVGYATALLARRAEEERGPARPGAPRGPVAAVLFDEEPSSFGRIGAAAYELGYRSVAPRGRLRFESIPGGSTTAVEELLRNLHRRGIRVAVLYPPASGEPQTALHSALSEAGISVVSPYAEPFAPQTEHMVTARLDLAEAVAEELRRILDGAAQKPRAVVRNVASGHIGFQREKGNYRNELPDEIRRELDDVLQRLATQALVLSLPGTLNGE